MSIHLETERFILRDIEFTDIKGIYELDSDPEVHKYLGNKPIKTLEEAENSIQYIRKQYEENGLGRWAIIDKQTNDFVGWTGLKYEQNLRPNLPYYDLGYRLKRNYWGKGIATETAIASLKYGFTKLALTQICAAADVDNVASNRILTKVGLSFVETFLYEEIPVNWYKITNTEWLKLNSKEN